MNPQNGRPKRQGSGGMRSLLATCRRRAANLRESASRWVRKRRRVAPPDPEREALIGRMMLDLRAIHATAARYLVDDHYVKREPSILNGGQNSVKEGE